MALTSLFTLYRWFVQTQNSPLNRENSDGTLEYPSFSLRVVIFEHLSHGKSWGYRIILVQRSLAQASLASVPSSWQRAAAAHFAVGEQDDCGGAGKMEGLVFSTNKWQN